LVRFIGNI